MNATTGPRSDHVTKRAICALLAIAVLAGFVAAIFTGLHTGQVPTIGSLFGGIVMLWGVYVFGLYAIKGPRLYVETGALSEPSEEVKSLSLRPGSKVDAIRAYRQQTGLDLRRAKEVVERLASQGRHGA